MADMRIKVYPDQSGDNQYIRNLISQLEKIPGLTVTGISLNHKKLIFRFPVEIFHKSDYTVINWLENNIVSKSGKLSIFGVIKFVALILLFRASCRKLIYIRHNVYPHKLHSKYMRHADRFVEIFVHKFCTKVALSGHMAERGYNYVPHPLYKFNGEGCYKPGKGSDLVFSYVIFGRISRYKRIEDVLENWIGSETLLVLGAADDEEYLEGLQVLAKGRNVKIVNEQASDAKAKYLINNSKGVILPHNSPEMIASGGFFYAISVGANVYAINSPFYEWVMSEYSLTGVSTFNTASDLVSFLHHNDADLVGRDKILEQSDRCFGDQRCVAVWRRLLNSIE